MLDREKCLEAWPRTAGLLAGGAGGSPRGAVGASLPDRWVFITGGCSGRGVQWMGVVLYNKAAYNIM